MEEKDGLFRYGILKMINFNSFLIDESIDKALSSQVRKTIKGAGGKIYQIGGAVRDEILGKVSKDLDLLIVGVELDRLGKILSQYGKVNLVGKSFGILKFTPEGSSEEIDVSVPRVDEKSTGKGHKDFEVKLGKGITLQQDQLRRDFWMNALAKDVDTGEVIDVEGQGKLDIENQQVRVIAPQAFKDDPLRMLRAVQFAARFNFKIESNTLSQIKKNAKLIKTVSPDRFQEEFRKMFEKGTPSIGLKWFQDTGLSKQLFPKVRRFDDTKTMDLLAKPGFPGFIGMMLKDYGKKVSTLAQEKMRLSNHDAGAAQDVANFITHNPPKHSEDLVKFVSTLSKNGMNQIDIYLSAKGQKTISDRLKELKKKGIPTNLKELSVSGRELTKLGLRGPKIGQALEWLLNFAIKKGTNNKNILLSAVEKEFGAK